MNPPSEFLIRHISITRSRHPDIKCRTSDRHGLGCEFIEILPGRTDLQVWGQSIKIQFPLIIFSHQIQMKSLILKTMVTKVQTQLSTPWPKEICQKLTPLERKSKKKFWGFGCSKYTCLLEITLVDFLWSASGITCLVSQDPSPCCQLKMRQKNNLNWMQCAMSSLLWSDLFKTFPVDFSLQYDKHFK